MKVHSTVHCSTAFNYMQTCRSNLNLDNFSKLKEQQMNITWTNLVKHQMEWYMNIRLADEH